MVVGGEQGPAAIDLVQMLDRRPGDGQAVIGRRAAADFIQDDQRPGPRLVEDRRGLDHFDHEGRASARQIVGRADPAEQAVDDADMGRRGRNVRTHLGEDGDQGVLAQEGALARHVGTGHQPQALRLAEVAAVGYEAPGLARRGQGLDHRMAAALDLEGQAVVHLGAAVASARSQFGQGGSQIEAGQGAGGAGDIIDAGRHFADQIVE